MLKLPLYLIMLLIILITGCTSTPKRLDSMIAKPIEEIPLSEEEAEKRLAAIFQSWENLEQSVTIAPNKDGFTVNGEQFLDPDGKIVKFAANHATGDVSYLVDKGYGYVIKTSRVPQVKQAITIATVNQSGNGILSIQMMNGTQRLGQDVILLSRGFLIVGQNTVYRYLPGKGFSNFGVPGESFHIASYQNGDIANTNFILLEKTKTWGDNSNDPMNDIIRLREATMDLAQTFGFTTKEDYILVNLKTGKVHPFDISISAKKDFLSAFYQSRLSSDTLYTLNGLHPNFSHYFWRIKWFNSPSGIIAIAQEKGFRYITLTNLTIGQKVLAFKSFTGFNAGFNAVQDASGKITLTVDQKAYLPVKIPFIGDKMLETTVNQEKIDDVAEYIALHSKIKNMK